MRISEIQTEKTGWETAKPKVIRTLRSISKKIDGAEVVPNKTGVRLEDQLGYGREFGWDRAGHLAVYLYIQFLQFGAYGGNRLYAAVSVSVSGETVRMTGDGGIENERDITVFRKELEPDASAEEILAVLNELVAAAPKGVEVFNAEVAKLKAGPKA